MCDTLFTKDGIELRTIGEAIRYGISFPAGSYDAGDEDWCFCRLYGELGDVLAGHSSQWVEGSYHVFGRFAEVGPDGRTWWDGYDIEEKAEGHTSLITISRSDKRAALTLEEWEAAQKNGHESGRDLIEALRDKHTGACRRVEENTGELCLACEAADALERLGAAASRLAAWAIGSPCRCVEPREGELSARCALCAAYDEWQEAQNAVDRLR